MQKLHVAAVALLLAGAAVLGSVAVARTTGLGSAARQANSAALSARAKQLTAYAAKLRQELKTRPPALPSVPNPAPAASSPPARAPRVVYRQPPPIVVTLHKHHGDDGSAETDGEGGGDG